MERSYSLAEIDQMRAAIFQILWPTVWYSRTSGVTQLGSYPNRKDVDAAVEMRLRTYMAGGIDPQELFNESASVQAESERHRLSFPEEPVRL